MQVICFVNSVFQSNTYLLLDITTSEIYLVDFGDIEPVKIYIDENGLKPCGVFLTHTHFDHIYGLNELLRLYPALQVYTSEFGQQALGNDKLNLSHYNRNPFVFNHLSNVQLLKEGDRILLWNKIALEVIATPGHDKSCLTYQVDNCLFTGDSYIPGVKVITTFPNSDKEEAKLSTERILNLVGGRKIYPGHGDTTSS